MADSFSRYDVYALAGSHYCYRDTGVLKNRFGIRDAGQLKKVEADISAIRQNDLLERPIAGRFCQRQFEIVRKRRRSRRNFVVFRRGE